MQTAGLENLIECLRDQTATRVLAQAYRVWDVTGELKKGLPRAQAFPGGHFILWRGVLRASRPYHVEVDVEDDDGQGDGFFAPGGDGLSTLFPGRRRTVRRFQPIVREFGPSTWLIVALPIPTSGTADMRAREVIGMLVATAGGNSAIGPMDEIEYDFATRTFQFQIIKDQISAEARRTSDLSVHGLRKVAAFIEAADKLDPLVRHRLNLGCQWLSMAYREPNPQDAFLKLWICMEAVAMPRDNYRAAEELLASSYGVTHDEVRSRAQLGLLHRLRSKIVHAGYLPVLHETVAALAERVAEDLLHAVAMLPSPRRVFEAPPVRAEIWESYGIELR